MCARLISFLTKFIAQQQRCLSLNKFCKTCQSTTHTNTIKLNNKFNRAPELNRYDDIIIIINLIVSKIKIKSLRL